ncbi:DUF3168 domain-containing protein [Curtobacterium sp. MCBD17_003]|uniref:DUF3168 domain-containing protein n=1 Tax=Curtobacterium sp. MCBD17_003 TaxID=2175667 RepID=UPI0015E8DA42|nr:DUF3168 domain-containing protein [Curtobacterium sp. MCBD17_003]WIE54227.1 DUF3168 domain-containing protein [Curtobacterium sp. MCBD17_003]
MSATEHVDAVLARLREHADLAPRVFEGVADENDDGSPRTRYVTVWANSGRRTVGRYTGPQDVETYTFTVHSVSQVPSDVRVLADAVMQQLLGFVPAIDGRVCRRITHEVSEPLQYDRDLTPPLYWAAAEFDLISDPA